MVMNQGVFIALVADVGLNLQPDVCLGSGSQNGYARLPRYPYRISQVTRHELYMSCAAVVQG